MTVTTIRRPRDTHPLVAALTDLRKAEGRDRGAVAEAAGTRHYRLTQWETVIAYPTVEKLERWAAALGRRVTVRTHDGHLIPDWAIDRVLNSASGTRPGRLVAALTAYRRLLGIRQDDLAGGADEVINRSQFGAWESGRYVPSLWSLTKWAAALGCELVLVPAVAEDGRQHEVAA